MLFAEYYTRSGLERIVDSDEVADRSASAVGALHAS
jgi:hypothetical protein